MDESNLHTGRLLFRSMDEVVLICCFDASWTGFYCQHLACLFQTRRLKKGLVEKK